MSVEPVPSTPGTLTAKIEKGGVEPEELLGVVRHVTTSCSRLKLMGLMTIGMLDRDELPNPDFLVSRFPHSPSSPINPYSQCLAECRKTLQDQMPELQDLELSMGMSSDYEHAIGLGSTNVRVGSTIFGERARRS